MPEARIIPLNGDDRARARAQADKERTAEKERTAAAKKPARASAGRASAGRAATAKKPVRSAAPAKAPRKKAPAPAPAAAPPPAPMARVAPRPPSDAEILDAVRELARDSGETHRPAAGWERQVAGGLAFLRRRLTGDYAVDDFGFDPDLTDHMLVPAFRPIYRKWFRVEARGLHNVPDVGGALVVANHSGTLPIDSVMTGLALLDEHPAHRHLRMLAADLVFKTPFLAPLARKSGNTLACNADAERLLGSGELVGVWPEGFKGVGKPFGERYKLQRFGRGGFVSAALRAGVPIIPTAIVGAEEIYPMIGNAKPLARLLGLPYIPITPTFPLLGPLGLVPLPSKWIIEFGRPVDTTAYGPGAADDPMLVFNLTDQVRETIQQSLYRLLMQRRSVFF